MKTRNNQAINSVYIVGLGREGVSSYNYLSIRYPQADFILSDQLSPEKLDTSMWKSVWNAPRVRYLSVNKLAETLPANPKQTLLCKTPGIAIEHPAIAKLISIGCTLTSNTALFFEEVKRLEGVNTIGVTGTKGKSTTSSLITAVLQHGDEPVFFVGNIGNPPLDKLHTIQKAVAHGALPRIVLELSSHQLRELHFSPNISVLLDITPEHLDYYPTFESYWQAKANIARFQQPEDYLLYNPSYEIPSTIASLSRAKKIYFGNGAHLAGFSGDTFQSNIWYDQDQLYFGNESLIERSQLPVRGEHNALNTLPAIWVGKHFGLKSDVIREAILQFKPLPHRLQPAGTVDGIEYVNDSQATTPEASIAAIKSFPDRPITLIAGGSDKGVSFEGLAQVILDSRVKTLILFPPMGAQIKLSLEKAFQRNNDSNMTPKKAMPSCFNADSMEEAITLAAKHSEQGSVVLLSPACASFGMFANYQDRGNQFIKNVIKIKSNRSL